MRYLTLTEILRLHDEVIKRTGGGEGIRNLSDIISALSQPKMTFDQQELYSSLESKASAMCYSLVMNHPFVDGNKRIGHAALEVFLYLNGFELDADVDESEGVFLNLAAGKVSRDQLTDWITSNVKPTD